MTFPSHEDLGTADALRLVHGRLVAENIMLVSSDLLVDVNQVFVQATPHEKNTVAARKPNVI